MAYPYLKNIAVFINWRSCIGSKEFANKSLYRLSHKDRSKATEFDELDNLFDIANGNVLDLIRIEEDKLFLFISKAKLKMSSLLVH